LLPNLNGQKFFTDDGEKYYYNEETGQSEWEIPPEDRRVIENERKRAESTSKRCSIAGCSNKCFSGKSYCVTHLKAEEQKTSTTQTKVAATKVIPVAAGAVKIQSSAAVVTPAAVTRANPAGGVKTQGVATKTVTSNAAGPVVGAAAKTNKVQTSSIQATTSKAAVAAAAASYGVKPQAGGAGGAGGASGAGAATTKAAVTAAAAPKKAAAKSRPPDWTEEYDDSTGCHYYYNHVTSESRWEPPPGWN